MENIICKINELVLKNNRVFIGIDGPGGSGKSTLAEKLHKEFPSSIIVHMDDFYKPSKDRVNVLDEVGINFDWRRLQVEVLDRFKSNGIIQYKKYDWRTDNLSKNYFDAFGSMIIVEGVYSTRDELRGYYDYTIFVECPKDLRLRRGIERDGEEARGLWENQWMPEEDKYLFTQNPKGKVNIIIDGY